MARTDRRSGIVEASAIQRLNLPFRSAITLAEGALQDFGPAGVAGANAGIGSRLDEHQRGERS
jgi:hypothetical protein